MSITFDGGIRTSHLKCQKLNFKQKLLVSPQVTWKFQGIHLDRQYLGPGCPYRGHKDYPICKGITVLRQECTLMHVR